MHKLGWFFASWLVVSGSVLAITSDQDNLISAAATDFSQMQMGKPVAFRQVYLGKVGDEQTGWRSLLCGEYQTIDPNGIASWQPFATIKTSPYEQWLGQASATYCQSPMSKLELSQDLSEALFQQFQQLVAKPTPE